MCGVVAQSFAGVAHGEHCSTRLPRMVQQSGLRRRNRTQARALEQQSPGATLDGVLEIVVSVAAHAAYSDEAFAWCESARIMREAVKADAQAGDEELSAGSRDKVIESDHVPSVRLLGHAGRSPRRIASGGGVGDACTRSSVPPATRHCLARRDLGHWWAARWPGEHATVQHRTIQRRAPANVTRSG